MPLPREDPALPGGARPAEPPSRDRVRPGALSALLAELVLPPAEEPASPWDAALRPGATIGRFELVREVGRGGFGVVWEARDTALGRTVAFKAVRLGARPGVREERLLQEAEAAARLSHPNIVTLHDVGRCEQGPYLVLELLRGRTLAERLADGPMAVAEALRIASEIAKGLAHAHERGVVHRDLTPGNVFLCGDGQVKLLDLGLAHAFGRRKLEGGTPAYMAPEQERGAPEDERTDVYALGAILHHLLAGEPPFAPGARRGPPPRLEVPGAPALGELVARCLAPDPVERPRDAGEVRAALEGLAGEALRAPSTGRPVPVRRRRGRAIRTALLVTVGVAVGAAAAALLVRGRDAARPPGASIAVLPFADLSPQADQAYFADGLAEEILNALARVDGLHVAGRTSSFAFRGRGGDLRDVGARLKVGAVLEGSVRKAGNRVRIAAQVVDIASGYHLWSDTFDRELTDVFAVQDEIARAVVSALRVKLVQGEAPSTSGVRTANPAVYERYLEGRAAYGLFTEDGFRRAIAAYERALALDDAYAPAWAGLAIPLHYAAEAESDPRRRADLRQRAMAAAERAVELDPALAEGYTARGYLRAAYRWDWRGAESDVDRARALAPNDPTVLRRLCLHRLSVGRVDEALAAVRRAVDLDPMVPANWVALGSARKARGEYALTRAAYQRAREIAPRYEGLDYAFAFLSLREGDAQGALEGFGRARDEADRLHGTALAQHALGREREARAALEALVERHGSKRPYMVASAQAALGDRESAFAWLERAFGMHDLHLNDIRLDPLFEGLRGDPRYASLLRRMNLPDA
jgi:serine/threonine-protein kinase